MSKLLALSRALLGLADRLAFAPPLIARLVVGVVFAHSGWGKLHNLDQVAQFFASLGIPFAELQAPFVAGVELGCGLLVLLGLATRIAAIPLIGTMVVALATALAPKITGVNALFGLSEFLYIALLAQLAIGGGGALSLDALVAPKLGLGRASRGAGGMPGAMVRA
ncbi:MAG: DoxX family protein [Deltaproteobacteria bacterium]|nr:DoxX family protein [Deltaproteobacteria bacterium]